jgi:hypothetical protein
MKIAAGALLAAALLSACATTRVTSEWRNPEVTKAGPYGKVFLTAITQQDAVRRQMEDAFQAALKERGVIGLPSYGSLPAAGKAEKDKLVAAVKASGADAALVFRMVKSENRVTVAPTYYGPTGYYSGYYAAWDGFYNPVSVYEYVVVTLEAKLFDVAAEKLVWVASTETMDPGKLQQEIAGYAKLICDRIGDAGFLSKAAP